MLVWNEKEIPLSDVHKCKRCDFKTPMKSLFTNGVCVHCKIKELGFVGYDWIKVKRMREAGLWK